MVWNNVNISKSELEKKQKEYSRMAMEMAKRAQKNAPAAVNTVTTVSKAEKISDIHRSAANVIPTVNAEKELKPELSAAVQPDENKSQSIVQVVSDKTEVNIEKADISATVQAEVQESESVAKTISDKAETTAEKTSDSIPAEVAVNEETDVQSIAVPAPLNSATVADISEKTETAEQSEVMQAEKSENDTKKKAVSSNTADTAIYTDKSPEAVQASTYSDIDTDDGEECIDISDDDPKKLFESIFITEEQADEKIEKLISEKESAAKKAPDFNSYIQSHNRMVNNCNCENCRKKREAAKHIQEKGGQKGTSY